jgi:hypothetical protein
MARHLIDWGNCKFHVHLFGLLQLSSKLLRLSFNLLWHSFDLLQLSLMNLKYQNLNYWNLIKLKLEIFIPDHVQIVVVQSHYDPLSHLCNRSWAAKTRVTAKV